MFSEDFPWYRFLLGSLILFFLITLSNFFPLSGSLRMARYALTVALWMVIVFSSQMQNKQDADRRQKEFDQFVRRHEEELSRYRDTEQLRGDSACQYSAGSPLLRCAVNPSGPCEECPDRAINQGSEEIEK